MFHRNTCPPGVTASRRDGWKGPRRFMMVGLVFLLAGCAGDSGPLAWLGREPDVPKVAPGPYPGFATKEVKRPPVLDPAGQQRMETDLRALAQQTRQRSDEADKPEQ